MPLILAYAINCPMCSLAWTMMRRYMPSALVSRSAMWTLRARSAGLADSCAVFTTSRDYLSHLITSALLVTDFSAFSGFMFLNASGNLKAGSAWLSR
jgi:hypothetical protein